MDSRFGQRCDLKQLNVSITLMNKITNTGSPDSVEIASGNQPASLLGGTASREELVEKLEQLTRDLNIRFVDDPDLQRIELPGCQPVYFVSSESDHSENLPGGSCGENMRAAYPSPENPYEPLVTAFFQLLSKTLPEIRMMDIGALWGHTSLLAAAIFKSSSIHLFEMNPITEKYLKKNTESNSHLGAHFYVNNILLSDIDAVTDVTFKHYTARVKDKTANKISQIKVLRENLKSKLKRLFGREGKGDYLKQQIPVNRIDTYCKTKQFVPNVIKIDVEGSQFDILSGATDVLGKYHPLLLVEFDSPYSANSIGKSNLDVIRLLEGYGYKCIWGNHRVKNAKLSVIDSNTKLDIETNSLGIFI